VYCPRCGTDNRESAQFCEKCGFNLPAAAAAAAPNPGAYSAPYAQPVPSQPAYQQPYAQPAPPVDPRMRMPGQVTLDPGGRRYAEGKNPAVALILSLFITGVGQLYNGDIKKCFLMWGVCVVVILLAVMTGGVGGFLWFGVWIWSMVDAYNVASRKSPIW